MVQPGIRRATAAAGLTATLVLAALLPPLEAVAAPGSAGRLFVSAQQCESARALTPGACRTAFANALAEFSAKVPTYASRRACFKAFGPCMPWPIGTRRFSQFRPQWIGITVGQDMTAAPAVAPGHVTFDFVPQSVSALSPTAAAAPAKDPEAANQQVTIMTPDGEGEEAGGVAVARPGRGFTMIDGVLTYPAPARFQPKASRHP